MCFSNKSHSTCACSKNEVFAQLHVRVCHLGTGHSFLFAWTVLQLHTGTSEWSARLLASRDHSSQNLGAPFSFILSKIPSYFCFVALCRSWGQVPMWFLNIGDTCRQRCSKDWVRAFAKSGKYHFFDFSDFLQMANFLFDSWFVSRPREEEPMQSSRGEKTSSEFSWYQNKRKHWLELCSNLRSQDNTDSHSQKRKTGIIRRRRSKIDIFVGLHSIGGRTNHFLILDIWLRWVQLERIMQWANRHVSPFCRDPCVGMQCVTICLRLGGFMICQVAIDKSVLELFITGCKLRVNRLVAKRRQSKQVI